MGLFVDKLSGNVFLFDIPTSTGTSSGSTATYQEVNVFSQLPNPLLHNGEIFVVRQPSGLFMVNRKEAGLYYSNSIVWTRLGDIPSFFNDDNFEIYDGTDNTKRVRFELSGLTSNNFYNINLRDSNGTIGYVEDLSAYTTNIIFSGFTGVTAPTTYLKISNFNTYSASTLSNINSRLLTSNFNVYSASTLSNINSRLLASNFNTYSANTLSSINNKIETANNGLTKSGINVHLGGILTGDTTIDLDVSTLEFQDVNGGLIKIVNTTDITTLSSNNVRIENITNGINITTNSIEFLGNQGILIPQNPNGIGMLDHAFSAAFIATSETADMGANNINTGDEVNLIFSSNGGASMDAFFIDDRAIKRGIEYNNTGYVTQLHSLTDKEYVDKIKLDKILLVSSNTTLSGLDDLVLVATTGGTFTITLPLTPVDGYKVNIKDDSNFASTNNITISGNGKNIDGSNNFIINTNYGSVKLVFSSVRNKWYVISFIN